MPGKDAVMEAAFEDAEIQQEVDEFVKGDVHQENVELQMDDPVTESTVVTSSARGKPMWNRETGVMSMVLTDQAKLRIGQLFPMDHPDPKFRGQRVYTPTPMQLLNPGKMMCRLHKDHPDHKHLDSLGFTGIHCPKDNMLTMLDVDMHFEHKHRGAFKVVEKDEDRQHKAAMLEMQRLQMESMQALVSKSQAEVAEPETIACPEDECPYTGTPNQVRGHKSIHSKAEAATVS